MDPARGVGMQRPGRAVGAVGLTWRIISEMKDDAVRCQCCNMALIYKCTGWMTGVKYVTCISKGLLLKIPQPKLLLRFFSDRARRMTQLNRSPFLPSSISCGNFIG